MRTLLTALALLLAPGAALACSCIQPTVQRTIVPPDGATGIPIDAAVRVWITGGVPENIRARLGEEYRLVGPQGPVEVTARLTRTRLDLAPSAPLAPNTAYRLEQLFAYDTEGDRVDDDARLRLALRGGWVATRRWYPVARFTTGQGSAAAPATPEIAELSAHFAQGGGDCGPGSALVARFTPGDPLLAVELEVDGLGVVATAPMVAGGSLRASDMLCTPDKLRLGKGPFVARLAVVGPSGARASSVPKTASGAGLFGRAGPVLTPPKPAWADAWFKGAIRPSPPNAAAGPPRCAAGVEARAIESARPTGGRRAYDERNPVAWIGGDPRPLVIDAGALAVQTAGGALTRIEAPATDARSAPLGDGTALVITDHSTREVRLTVAALDATGGVRWRTPLVADALNWRARIAACGGRIQVAWERIVGQDYGGATVHWAILDAATGAVVQRAEAGLPLQGEGMALGCGGDDVAWLVGRGRSARGLHLVRFEGDGVSTPQPLPSALRAVTAALAPDPRGALLVTDERAIQATIIDAKGAIVAGPFPLGQGRKPAALAAGAHFLVAWERYPAWQAMVTAVDGDGRIAEAAQIGSGWSTVGLAHAADGPALVATAGEGVSVARLGCRPQPAEGAPARLP